MLSLNLHPRIALIAILCSSIFLTATTLARTPVPPPAGGGQGITIFDADMALPYTQPMQRFTTPRAMGPVEAFIPQSEHRSGMIGGDDVVAFNTPFLYRMDFASASNGDMYAVAMQAVEEQNIGLVVRRSTDGGSTWETWASFSDPDPLVDYWSPSIHIAEGTEDRIFLAWNYLGQPTSDYKIETAWSPLAETADFTVVTLHEQNSYNGSVSITSDAVNYNSYYMYAVFKTGSGDLSEIHFARSIDMGETWEESYAIAAITGDDRSYFGPHISYGFGDYVHVAWTFHLDSDDYDNAVRYRRVPSWGNGGIGNWDPIRGLTSYTDGYDDDSAAITASTTSSQVLLGFDRHASDVYLQDSGVVLSEDQGDNFGPTTILDNGIYYLGDIVQHPTNNNWLISGCWYGKAGYVWAPASDPTGWNDHTSLADVAPNHSNRLFLDPTHENQVAMVWGDHDPDGSYRFMFDAQWRSGEGFPNFDSGFPVDLVHQPVSDPAVVDLDGDGYLEIIFGDSGGNIQVFRFDGTTMPGWPVYLGRPLSEKPIATGDLNGDGVLTVLAGTEDGWVYGFDPSGSPAPGWPLDTGLGVPASAIIGNLGPPYPRTAVVTCGGTMRFLNYHAIQVPGTYIWEMASDFGPGPAIGDIDGDGINEVVFNIGTLLLAAEQTAYETELYRNIGEDFSGAPTLGDFDLDGDVEIVVPTENGSIFLVDGDGSDFPGNWPYHSTAGTPMTTAAIGNCLGMPEPEIVACSRSWSVHLLWEDGILGVGYPVETDGWYLYGSPVMGRVNGTSSDVVIGARGAKAWAWANLGSLIEGWPKLLEDNCYLAPAMGDLDLDGSNEIVFLTTGQLIVVDVNNSPNGASYTWAMSGHDPQRTGCSDCPEDMATPVADDDPDRVTRISFAAPSPNPVSGSATFEYAVPVRAVVELIVYDLRGRRIALVNREENEAGRHIITWNGRDDQGRSLASGNYVAALRVKGPGVDQTLTRKVTVLR